MENGYPRMIGVYVFVEDLPVTMQFYELLGLSVTLVSDMYAWASLSNGVTLEFGTESLTRSYDPNWQSSGTRGTNTIGIELASPGDVDSTWERLIKAGYTGHLAPCDPPWQARFAIVLDPDGNYVGLHSPRDRIAEAPAPGT